MIKNELEKYIKRFPESTQQALSHERLLQEFLCAVEIEYKPIKVYRAVLNSDSITAWDFVSTVDEHKMTLEKIEKRIKKDKNFKICQFGTSVNEDLANMLASLKYPSEKHKGIAIGLMKQEFGMADFEEGKTHHNLYIFQDKMDELIQSFKKYE